MGLYQVRNALLRGPNHHLGKHHVYQFLTLRTLSLNAVILQVPSTVNRVYGLVYPEVVSFRLNYTSGLVLPLQGFWNSLVYAMTSLAASKALYRSLRYGRQRPPRDRRSSSSATTNNILPSGRPNPFPYVLSRLPKK